MALIDRDAVVAELKAALDEHPCGCSPCHGHAERDATYENCMEIVEGMKGSNHMRGLREELRVTMLNTQTTKAGDTANDGFAKGIAFAIEALDRYIDPDDCDLCHGLMSRACPRCNPERKEPKDV